MLRASNTLVADYTFISPLDPAVDRDVSEPDPNNPDGPPVNVFEHRWQMYLNGQGDAPLRPGEKPTIFTLRHLRALERQALAKYVGRTIEDRSEAPAACVAACALALVSVENMVDDDGRNVVVTHEMDTTGMYPVRIATQATLNLLGMDVCVSIGSRVIERMSPVPS